VRNNFRSIMHADIGPIVNKDTGRVVSPATQKSILFVIASYERTAITIQQISWLCGISRAVVIYAMVELQDRGFINRVAIDPMAEKLPRRHHSKQFAYAIHWATVRQAGRVDLMPPTTLKAKQPKEGASE